MTEFTPCANTHAHGIPAQTGLFGRFREPEIAMVEKLKCVGTIENSRMLAFVLAVVASKTYIFVSRHKRLEAVELLFKALLSAKISKPMEFDKVQQSQAYDCPAITSHRITAAATERTFRSRLSNTFVFILAPPLPQFDLSAFLRLCLKALKLFL